MYLILSSNSYIICIVLVLTLYLLQNLNFIMKMLVVGIYGKIVLYKYVSCWIVAEGSCIYSGIAIT